MSSRTLSIVQTTIGKKAVMAVSGLVLLGFVFFHMLGNLQVFVPPEMVGGKAIYAMDEYAKLLRTVPAALWAARLVLLVSIGAHIWAAISLVGANKAARPVAYQAAKHDVATTYAAKTMQYGGPLLALFIIYHVLHLTLGAVGGGYAGHGNVQATILAAFGDPLLVGVYVAAQVLLGLHLYHGAWSLLQTLGLSHPRYNHWRTRFSAAFALIVAGGNIAISLGVFAGLGAS